MARVRLVHRCTDCGAAHPKWAGRCPTCDAWNTLVEEVDGPDPAGPLPLPPAGAPTLLSEVDVRVGPRPRRPASASSTACSAAAWWPARSRCSAASRASARARCSPRCCAAWPGPHAVRQRRGERPAGALARRAARRVRPPLWVLAETVAAAHRSPRSTRCSPTLVVVDSIQTVADPELRLGAGQRRAGARLRPPPGARGEARAAAHRARRPRHQGRRARRARARSSTWSTPC